MQNLKVKEFKSEENFPRRKIIDLGEISLAVPYKYGTKFWPLALMNIIRRHNPSIPQDAPSFKVEFSYTRDEQKKWHKFFNVKEGDVSPSFVYGSIPGTIAMYNFFSVIGLNMKHLLHFKNTIEIFSNNGLLEPDKNYKAIMNLEEIIPWKKDRILALFASEIYDNNNVLISRNSDYMFIKNCDEDMVKELHENYGDHNMGLLHNSGIIIKNPQWQTWESDRKSFDISIANDAGVQYGNLSGDKNPVHISSVAAKLFGFSKPFIQGYCTANYVMKELAQISNGKINYFDISFLSPVFVGEDITIHINNESFEVVDANNRLLVSGKWN